MSGKGNKTITWAATVLLIVLNLCLFALVWARYYNRFAFRSHRAEGLYGSLLVWYVVYRWLSKLYRGYSIASSAISETVLSQFISFGIADLILYVACCLLRRSYVNVWPGAFIVLLQLVGSTFIVFTAKRVILAVIQPSVTALIYGCDEDRQKAVGFIRRLSGRYGHLFNIRKVVREDDEKSARNAIDHVDTVIFSEIDPRKRAEYVEYCVRRRRTFLFVPEFADIICSSCQVKNFLDTPLMRYEFGQGRRRSFALKRLLDLFFSILFLVLLSPVMLLTALAIRLEDGGPVFFRQERVTLAGRKFTILKFRSMVVDAEKRGAVPATKRDPRITKVGAFIRATRLDETPQLVNILLGQMSFVGPRPERSLHVLLYEEQLPEFRYRLKVKGGLTGYAQVYGKYNTSPEDKLKLDMLYIENQSLMLDFKLILLTIKTIFIPESTEGFDASRSEAIRRSDGNRKGDK